MLKLMVSNILPSNAAGKKDLHDAETDIDVRSPYSIPFASLCDASEFNARILSENAICREQLSILFQR